MLNAVNYDPVIYDKKLDICVKQKPRFLLTIINLERCV